MRRSPHHDARHVPRQEARVLATLAILAASLLAAFDATTAVASQRSEMLYSKGLVRLHEDDNAAALQLFDQAVQADPDDAHALYYRAMARGRLHDTEGAIDDLERVIALDPSLDEAVLELGYLQHKAGRYDEAAETLDIARTRPQVADEADILWLDNERMRFEAGAGGRRYRLLARVGLEYDTNVPLAPTNDVLRAGLLDGVDESDGRTTLDASGVFSAYSSEKLRISLRYDFEQSLHFELDEFDIQTHRATVNVASNTGQVHYGLRGSYAYSSNDGDDLVLEGIALPWLRIVEGDWGSTDAYYRMRARDFIEDPFEDVVSGFNHAVGVRQFFNLGRADRYVLIGYRFDHEDPDHDAGDFLGYNGQQAETGIGGALTDRLFAQAIYAYRYEDYDSASDGREDNEHNIWLRGEAVLTDWASLIAGYRVRINDSNQKVFKYDDQVASLAIELSY